MRIRLRYIWHGDGDDGNVVIVVVVVIVVAAVAVIGGRKEETERGREAEIKAEEKKFPRDSESLYKENKDKR